MKKLNVYILLYVCLAVFFGGSNVLAATVHTFAPSSVMSSGKWVKIRVKESGIYKITYDQIRAQGLDPNDIHVFGYGGAMLNENFSIKPIDDLPQTAIYNSDNYILFYAQGPISWQYNSLKGAYEHIQNPYSSYGYYFLASGVSDVSPKTIQLAPAVNTNGETPVEVSDFTDYRLYEKDLVNIAHSGREFYGETIVFGASNAKTFSFDFPNFSSGSTAFVEFDGAVNTTSNDTEKSYFSISGNGTNLFSAYADNIPTSEYYWKATAANNSVSFKPATVPINIKVTFNKSSKVESANSWLNYIRMTAKRQLIMTNNVMFFRDPSINSRNFSKFNLQTSNSNLKIWDLTNPAEIQEMPKTYADGKISFVAKKNTENRIGEFVAVDVNGSFSAPEFVGAVENQNLHIAKNHDFVIISHPDFLPQAERLAQAHLEKDNISTLIVTPEQVYNEFSSGTPDATAYRRLMKMFYERKNEGKTNTETKYLLLFGNGSYDNRQVIIPTDNSNKTLTFQSKNSLRETASYVTDDYFGFLNDNEGVYPENGKLAIGIGRFPVTTIEQAEGVVNKIIKYMNNKNLGAWKSQLCYVGDDSAKGENGVHAYQADSIARMIERSNPEFQIHKLYLDAYIQQKTATGTAYPEVSEKLQNLIKKGILILNYTGHGGTTGWAHEQIITKQKIMDMRNENLALWITATCDFSRFDSRDLTAGECVLLNPNGGGIALLTTTRTVYSEPNFRLNRAFASNVFKKNNEGKRLSLGDIIKNTKRDELLGNDPNKLNFTLLGDPALTLNYPAHEIITDSINGIAADEQVTVCALDLVTVKGHIVDENSGTLINDFNGVVTLTIFDKEEEKQMLDNNQEGLSNFKMKSFKERPALFSGKAEVINGEFTITFLMPKDINYSFGIGKISYYAGDTINDYEAHGYHDKLIIGGSNNGIFSDDEGPIIDLYLNTPTFLSGDRVNPTPLLVAHLFDEHGINIVGNGIGHDIIMMLNNDNRNWTVLNEYFESDLGTFQSGTVQYKLPVQANGKYTLTLRAWDLLNNSSTATIEFEIANVPVGILDAYCFPNPARDYVQFVLEHDRPDDVLDVTVHVFDLSGRELWNYSSDFYTSGNTLYIKEWNLTTTSGQKIKTGIYLFKIDVSSSSGKMSTKTKKIIVN